MMWLHRLRGDGRPFSNLQTQFRACCNVEIGLVVREIGTSICMSYSCKVHSEFVVAVQCL